MTTMHPLRALIILAIARCFEASVLNLTICAPTCAPWLLNNGVCESICATEGCKWDGGDCEPRCAKLVLSAPDGGFSCAALVDLAALAFGGHLMQAKLSDRIGVVAQIERTSEKRKKTT